ncbi:hypothetical protein HBA54_04780 [Pelagibius litoralis]|uniref:Uncharacterized protein n=1 Tax=Pelagibius litoralis TaxID=374515 RepID=A0A967C3K2_9PROT|nr:hypothetical protein [Pelagibius litoralis]NIA67900.1 hypothetical protein [Pelagibius litoralis]
MTDGKITLPPPDWLTLPEVLEFLDSQGIEAEGGAEALERAFRDRQIRTRGRSKEWHGHDTKTELKAIAWDDAKADWRRSTLRKCGRWVEYEITEVDVSWIGLARWLGPSKSATPPAAHDLPASEWSEATTPADQSADSAPRYSEAKASRWLKEGLYPFLVSHGIKTTEDDDWAALKAKFPGAPRRLVRGAKNVEGKATKDRVGRPSTTSQKTPPV